MRCRSWGVMSRAVGLGRAVYSRCNRSASSKCSFQSQVPLSIDLLGTRLQVIERGERNIQLRWLNRFQETGGNDLVDAVAAHCLTGLLGQLSVGLSALVAGSRPISQIADVP